MSRFYAIIFVLLLVFLVAFAQNVRAADTDNDGYSNWYDADFNNDGIVNFADLSVLRALFGTDAALADLTGDGVVNFADLARFRALFGKPPGGTATITWTAPTLNADDTPITDLAGYKVYKSTSLTAPWTDPIDAIDTTILIDNLRTGTWYFRVKAADETGNLSVDSETGSKEIQ